MEPFYILRKPFEVIFKLRKKFSETLIVPFILYISFESLPFIKLDGWLDETIYFVAHFLITVHTAIVTHRLSVLGSDSIPKWGAIKWGKRESIFSLHLLLIILMYEAIYISYTKNSLLAALLTVILFVICTRISLIFPIIAINGKGTIYQSWIYTRNSFLDMVVILWIYPFFIYLITSALVNYDHSVLFVTAVNYLQIVLLTSTLSFTYVEISGAHGEFL